MKRDTTFRCSQCVSVCVHASMIKYDTIFIYCKWVSIQRQWSYTCKQRQRTVKYIRRINADRYIIEQNQQNQRDALLSFIFDNILYMFRIGKLFIIRRQCYMQRLVCVMHSCRLAATTVTMECKPGMYLLDEICPAMKV